MAQADGPTSLDSLIAEPAPPPPVENESVRIRGVAFFDYAVTAASPDEDEVGSNSFDYRRVRLTADFTMSESISSRVRLEGSGTTQTAQGNPSPYFKDIWVRWKGPLADGHRLTLGVQPPPLFDFSESVWGYRSLEATVMDRVKANSSRDLGIRADGPLAPEAGLSYSVMVGDGRGIRPEDRGERAKHVYAQIQARPSESTRASIGVDYSPYEADDSLERNSALKGSIFAGTVTDTFRGGVEAFVLRTDYEEDARPQETGVGVSAFGSLAFGDSGEYRAVGRVDYVEADASPRSDEPATFVLLGGGYAPIPALEILPNVLISKVSGQDSHVTARVTVHARF